MDLYSVQDITFAQSTAVVTQKLSKMQAVMAVAKEHPVVATGVGAGIGTVGYFLGMALLGDDGGGDSSSATEQEPQPVDRHDNPFNISTGDNSPVTIVYQSSQTGP